MPTMMMAMPVTLTKVGLVGPESNALLLDADTATLALQIDAPASTTKAAISRIARPLNVKSDGPHNISA